jgi:hypothetical protein
MWVRGNKPEMAPTKVPTVFDIAWAAGFYEGEGNCRLAGKTKRGFMASVVQKDPEALYRLRDWFGGKVHVRSSDPLYGNYVWDICGDHGRIFMALIYEHMSGRRKKQIDVSTALLFLGDKSPVGLSIEELKKLLAGYYEENTLQQIANDRENKKKSYEHLRKDPVEVEKMRERSRLAREAMTPEQREMSRKYQQRYYQRRIEQNRLKVFENNV